MFSGLVLFGLLSACSPKADNKLTVLPAVMVSALAVMAPDAFSLIAPLAPVAVSDTFPVPALSVLLIASAPTVCSDTPPCDVP